MILPNGEEREVEFEKLPLKKGLGEREEEKRQQSLLIKRSWAKFH